MPLVREQPPFIPAPGSEKHPPFRTPISADEGDDHNDAARFIMDKVSTVMFLNV